MRPNQPCTFPLAITCEALRKRTECRKNPHKLVCAKILKTFIKYRHLFKTGVNRQIFSYALIVEDRPLRAYQPLKEHSQYIVVLNVVFCHVKCKTELAACKTDLCLLTGAAGAVLVIQRGGETRFHVATEATGTFAEEASCSQPLASHQAVTQR